MNSPAIDTRGARASRAGLRGAAETRLAWKLRLERDADGPTRRRNRERPARNDQGIARSERRRAAQACVCVCGAAALHGFCPVEFFAEKKLA